jgi:hypothetical protein
MNLRSTSLGALARFITNYSHAKPAGRRIHVFIAVPFDFSKSRQTKKAVVKPRTLEMPVVADGVHEQLNGDLMWTWFLPNPLPPSTTRK